MSSGRQATSALAAAAIVALLAAAPAWADGKVVRDGNDVAGPLDIKSATQGHAGASFVTHTVSTFQPFASSSLVRRTSFTFQFTSHNLRGFTKFVFVFWERGRLRALVGTRTRLIGTAGVSSPNSRTIRVKVARRFLDSAGYGWIVASFVPSGFDVIPNRNLVFHDLAGPTISGLHFPDPSTEASATPTFPVSFNLSDASPRPSWQLEWRPAGSQAWSIVATGVGNGSHSAQIAGVQGATYEFRVRATDAAGNATTSATMLVSVPLDDSNAAFATAYTGVWNGGNDGYLGTLHWATPGTSSFSYTFTGTYFAWIANTLNPMGGSATVIIDSVATTVDLSTAQARLKTVFEASLAAGSHTVQIVPLTGATIIDALVFR